MFSDTDSVKMKFAAFFAVLLAMGCQSKSTLKFTTVKCGVSMKSAIEPYCYIKAYSRKYPMLNFGFTLLRKIPDGSVRMVFVLEFKRFKKLQYIFSFSQPLNTG